MRAQLGELVGMSKQREHAIAIRSVVVRLPATSSRLQVMTISRADRRSPASSAATRLLIRSAPLRPRRTSMARAKQSLSPFPAAFNSAVCSGDRAGLERWFAASSLEGAGFEP
jgi:hypothetical protein